VLVAIRAGVGGAARAFRVNATSRALRHAQLSFAAAWTSEWTFTVVLGVVAFRDGGAAAVGVVTFLRMVPAAALTPVATALADRLRRDRVLCWSCFVRAAAVAACAVTVAVDGPIALVYALAVVATAAFVVFRPAHSALLPSLCTTPLELTSAHVVRGLVDSVSTLAGPAIAAVLLAVADPTAAFACAAGLAAVAGVALLGLSYEPMPRTTGPPSSRLVGEAIDGVRALWLHRDVGVLVALAVAQTFIRGGFNVLVVVTAIDLFDSGDAGVGVLTAAVGAGAVAGSLAVSMIADGRRLAVLLGVGVGMWGLPLTIVGIVPRETATLALLAAIGVGNALVDVGMFTLPARLVPDAVLARVFGTMESLIALGVAFGSLAAPIVIALVGIRWALVVIGLVGPLAVAVSWSRLRAIDRSVTRRDVEIGMLRKVPMLSPLPMPAIENLAARACELTVLAGQAVFAQGDVGDRYYVIEHGDANVVRDGVHVRTLTDGQGFGEIALMRDVPRTASVVACTSLDLRTIERPDFVAAVCGFSASRAATDRVVAEAMTADAVTDDVPEY
jgi:MFS family permease